jgi:Protein kinase domain
VGGETLADELPQGAVVAGYRLDGVLGKGAMGLVYEATQLSLGRKVALKIMAPDLAADFAFRARFRREGPIQATVEHPNIITVYETGEHDGLLYLAMQLVRGHSLEELIQAHELDAPRTIRILHAVADALDSAHGVDLIHRDVKPQNILVSARNHPYLADFGITKGVKEAGLTRTGHFIGSLNYISPEQIRGEGATSASDIYALGAVLFECLTGEAPFKLDSEAAMLYAHLSEPPPKVTARQPNLPTTLDAVIERGMAKKPQDRPASAAKMIREAEACLSGLTADAIPIAVAHAPGSVAGAIALPGAPVSVTEAAAPRQAGVGRIRRALLVLLLGVVAMAGAGYEVGQGYVGGTVNRSLDTGAASIRVPAAWRGIAAPSIPGLALTRARAVASGSGAITAIGWLTHAGGKELLPASFLRDLVHAPSTDDPVQLAGTSAYRYKSLRVTGLTEPLTLLVSPTQVGVVGVLCLGSRASPASTGCETAASTLRLTGAKALPLGVDPKYARVLAVSLARLSAAAATEHALASAKTRRGQAELCERLDAYFSSAATVLARGRPGPDAADLNGDLLAALRKIARGYSAMSSAVRKGGVQKYDEARGQVQAAQTHSRGAVTSLRLIGYQ